MEISLTFSTGTSGHSAIGDRQNVTGLVALKFSAYSIPVGMLH